MAFVDDGDEVLLFAPPLFPSFCCMARDDMCVMPVEKWRWYFYLTAWARFFWPPNSFTPTTAMGNIEGDGADLTFEDSLALVKFPAAATIAAYETRWRQRSEAGAVADTEATTEFASKTVHSCAYPLLPRVAESRFGRVLRALASDYKILGADVFSSLSSSDDFLERLVLETLRTAGLQSATGHAGARTNQGKGELLQEALMAMFLPGVAADPYPLLFSVESTMTVAADGGTDSNNMPQTEAHRARLFAALTLEVFGRVKDVCVGMLMAFLNACRDAKRAEARVCGIIMGVIEYSIAYRCHREDSTGRCPLSAAALILCRLVDMQAELEGEGKTINSVSGVVVSSFVVACVQTLIFALVAGGPLPTQSMTNKQSGDGKQKRQPPEKSVYLASARALTLHEADAFLSLFFPALLQQIGFEWPWSECLRRAQQLEKSKPTSVSITDGIRLNSRAVFEEVLGAISHRTYFARLQNIFPGSYNSLLNAIFLKDEVHNGNQKTHHDDGNGGSGQRCLFVLPAYYKAAGEALVEFFKRSGLGMTTARETEQVLLRNTDVQPMVIQLQALGSLSEIPDGSNEQANYFTNQSDLLRTTRFSDDEKHRLLLRYRSEVLLASIVVYTQLQTVSLVQQLIRQLAPLFEKLLLPLMQETALRHSVVVTRKGESAAGGGGTAEFPIDFTPEFKVLLDDIHYGLYPLEWIPVVLNRYLQHEGTESDSAPSTTYSVFAAVAYQFGLVLHGNPQGLRGGDGSDYAVRVKAYRFFQTLLLNSLADSVLSSCDLEGTIAVAATRRVGANMQINILSNNDGVSDGEDVNTNSQTRVLLCGAASFHAVVNPHDAVYALAQSLLPPELLTPPVVARETGRRVSEEWLRIVVEWAQAAKAKFIQQQQQERIKRSSRVHLLFFYNTCTFDSVPLAREVIRGVRRRLVEKMRIKVKNKVDNASFVLLLNQHLLSLQGYLDSLGLLHNHSGGSNTKVLTAAKLLWSSPFFSNELRLTGYYAVDV